MWPPRSGVDPSQVVGHVSSSVEAGTFYIDVTATSSDPDLARTVANAAADTVTTLIPKIQGTTHDPATAAITDRALLPTAPYQPTPHKTEGLGALLGLLLGLGLTAMLEALDRSTRNAQQAADLSGAPLLGVVPRHKTSPQAVVVADALREPYRALRASVNFLNPDNPPVTIMVTSPMPGDGKTTTAINLATSMAEAGSEVLLVDADLRRGQLTQLYSLRRAPGMTTLITREAKLEDVVLKEGPMFLLAAGPTAPNPSELLGSQTAVDLLTLIRSRFDIVVIDAPPLLAVSDALALAPHVDAVLMVARHGQTARSAITEAQRRLAAVGCVPSGLIYNAISRREATDYYGQYAYVEA